MLFDFNNFNLTIITSKTLKHALKWAMFSTHLVDFIIELNLTSVFQPLTQVSCEYNNNLHRSWTRLNFYSEIGKKNYIRKENLIYGK